MGESAGSNVIVAHTNMDLDCFGSIVLARHLFPGYVALQSRHVHPAARTLVTMYRNHLDLLPSKEFKGQAVDHLVVLDTRSQDRVSEYFDLFQGTPSRIDVFDHHPSDSRDIPAAVFHECTLGSNTAFLGTLLMEQGIHITADDATIALAGIYADTGNFTHGNVTTEDFDVASFLLSSGASIDLVKTFLRPLRERVQIARFSEVLKDVSHRTIRGHSVLLSYTELDRPSQGLSAIVDKIFDLENPDVYFAIFFFKHNQSVLIISRNDKASIELDRLMGAFGGGGHSKAASATIKNVEGDVVFEALLTLLESSLRPAVTAADLMSAPVKTVSESLRLVHAAKFLEEVNHSGCPVQDEDGRLVGFLTLRDIMKARRAEQMHAPTKGYMTRRVIHASPETPVREVEEILLDNNIGHLPILEGDRMVGIVTRGDYLDFRKEEKARAEAVRARLAHGPPVAAVSWPVRGPVPISPRT